MAVPPAQAPPYNFLSRVGLDDPELWRIFDELSGMGESERLHVLRYNFEPRSLSDDADRKRLVDYRERLDRALYAVTYLEIGWQIGLDMPAAAAVPNWDKLRVMFRDSGALLRYVNANLYFGVRLFAGRAAPPGWMQDPRKFQAEWRRQNQRPFELLTPPSLAWSDDAETALAAYLKRESSPEMKEALCFLDGFSPETKNANHQDVAVDEPREFELWLRNLLPGADRATANRFTTLSEGLRCWAETRSAFYLSLRNVNDNRPQSEGRPAAGWTVNNPLAARFALADIYWIASVLRADVSAGAAVTYGPSSWLHLLRIHASLAGDTKRNDELLKAEEVLRSVFGYVSELVQNAIHNTSETERLAFEPELFADAPQTTARWTRVFDAELELITHQRLVRKLGKDEPDGTSGKQSDQNDAAPAHPAPEDWSTRIRTGRSPENLIGLALSGGGIRSATFGLGVLQGLQDLDILLAVDYLSTVSGGGFIGAWLVANVKRTQHWLGRLTCWDESIAHLRSYSSYLSPLTGVLSTDTWTLWGTWARNAFLIQLTGLAWLLSLLIVALMGKFLFVLSAPKTDIHGWIPWSGLVSMLIAAVVGFTLVYNFIDAGGLKKKQEFADDLQGWSSWIPSPLVRFLKERDAFPAAQVEWLAVTPSWVGSILVTGLIWGDATGVTTRSGIFHFSDTYSVLLGKSFAPWWIILVSIGVSFLLISFLTLNHQRWWAFLFSPLCTVAFYLQLCGIMRLFLIWGQNPAHYVWWAYGLGPSLMMAAFTITVVLYIGLSSRFSDDSIREWWTRYGALLAKFAVVYLAVTTAAVFGPLWMLALLRSSTHWAIKWGALGTGVLTIAGGLFAGNSSQTDGHATRTKARLLELLARAGGLVFIVAAVLAASTLLFIVLVNVASDFRVYDSYWDMLNQVHINHLSWAVLATLFCGVSFSLFFDINLFGLSQFYTNRIVRCYLGATRWAPGERHPQAFTAFDGQDDLHLSELGKDFRGPFPILNCAINLGGSSDLSLHTRHSASFPLTPLRCGSDRRKLGYSPTAFGEDALGNVMLGQAVAISGAAVSPNMGYNTSPLVAFLLTMFNVRLGWWFPSPGRSAWKSRGLTFSLEYLFSELLGLAGEDQEFVNISDGGHFENLGIYELVRRRCKLIIASDAECDESLTFASLGNLVRICDTDFGARIDIDISSVRKKKDDVSRAHCAVGKIYYSNGSVGHLIYLKASISGDEDVGVAQYRSAHPSFPHETTANQFFTEDQFESYRRLGRHVVEHSFRGTRVGEDPIAAAERMFNLLVPEGCTSEAFLTHSKALDAIWERFRTSPALHLFMDELTGRPSLKREEAISTEEACAASELIQLMENVFLDLRLDDFWEHPDNRGWAMLFTNWARSECFRTVWNESRRTFGIRFEYFCGARLGLKIDKPAVRV